MKLIKRTPTYLLALLLGLIPLLGQAAEHGGKEGAYPGYLALEPSLVVNLAASVGPSTCGSKFNFIWTLPRMRNWSRCICH